MTHITERSTEALFGEAAARIQEKTKDAACRVDAGKSFVYERFYISIQTEEGRCRLSLTIEKAAELQQKSPASLEHFLWGELEKQGFPAYKYQ